MFLAFYWSSAESISTVYLPQEFNTEAEAFAELRRVAPTASWGVRTK